MLNLFCMHFHLFYMIFWTFNFSTWFSHNLSFFFTRFIYILYAFPDLFYTLLQPIILLSLVTLFTHESFVFFSAVIFFFFTNDSFVLYMTFFHIWIFLCDCVFSQNDLFDVFMYFTCFLHDYFFTCDFCTVHDFLKLFVHFILTCNFYTLLHNSFLFMWLFFYIP